METSGEKFVENSFSNGHSATPAAILGDKSVSQELDGEGSFPTDTRILGLGSIGTLRDWGVGVAVR